MTAKKTVTTTTMATIATIATMRIMTKRITTTMATHRKENP